MKVFPTTVDFDINDEKPFLAYRLLIEEAGDYTAEVWTTPVNSVRNMRPLRFQLTAGKKNDCIVTTVLASFKAGDLDYFPWCQGVLDNIRINKISLSFDKGIQEISISALEAGLVLEKILIYRNGNEPLKSYLGPPESFYTK